MRKQETTPGSQQATEIRAGYGAADLYIASVVAAGSIAIGLAAYATAVTPPDWRWVVLVALTILGGTFTLRIPIVPVSFSISDTFTFTAALLFGSAPGTIVVAIDAVVISIKLWRKQRSVKKFAFNATAPALAMLLAATAFFGIAGTKPLADNPGTITTLLPQLVAFAALYFVLNTGLVALAVAVEHGQRPWAVWREHCLGLWLTYFGGAAGAAITLLLVSARQSGVAIVALVGLIPFILYASFRTAVARAQDSVEHLSQVNALYLSTIETLAQAIDARDHVTHDHIRRVQKYALDLARELSISDEQELRALEAASLLHDMGKLAVPEHILNKPGKLTAAEYERMKTHAAIGADILAPIGFPFPVERIVRHHHENWDGHGYPSALKGNQIPIGARILQVVDCFDAVTSDRPYRPALSINQAFDIIEQRSGTMYDPDVVAAFVRMKDRLSVDWKPPRPELRAIAQMTPGPYDARLGETATSMRTLIAVASELGQTIGTAADAASACTAVCHRLSVILPGVTVVVYRYAPQLDALVVRYGAGVHASAVVGFTMPLGQRLTGWVAAQRSTIINSEAALDLGNLTTQLQPTPQLCLSTCIANESELLGALTLYSTLDLPFSDNHSALVEQLATLMAPLIALEDKGWPLSLASLSVDSQIM